MRRRDRRIEQIKSVESEFDAIRLAIVALEQLLAADPSLLRQHGLDRGSLDRAIERLESTYMIRLFAEFETGLREAWRRAFGQKSHPKTVDLVRSIAARRQIPDGWRENVHRVRRYRNSLVHEDEGTVEPVRFTNARSHLCRYFSRLPEDW